MKLYHQYIICIRRIQFKKPCHNEIEIKWKTNSLFHRFYNKGKQHIEGFSYGETFETSLFHINILTKRSTKVIISIKNNEMKGIIKVSNRNGKWKWNIYGDIQSVDGTVEMKYFNQLNQFQQNEKQHQINENELSMKLNERNENNQIEINKKQFECDLLLFKEILSRDQYERETIIPMNQMKQHFIRQQKFLDEFIQQKLFNEIVFEMKQNISSMNPHLSQVLMIEISCERNEIFWLGCLISLRKQFVQKDSLTIDEIVELGKLLEGVDGIVSLIENSIAKVYKKSINQIVKRMKNNIQKIKEPFQRNGIIDEKIVGEMKNELMNIKQQMIMTKIEMNYEVFMKKLNHKLLKQINHFDEWESIIMKYIIDSISRWCEMNEIDFIKSIPQFKINTN